jgi:hypothetical protein
VLTTTDNCDTVGTQCLSMRGTGTTFLGVLNMQSGFYWVFIPSSDSPNWQVGHYDNEFNTVTVCGELDVYDVGNVVFGKRVIR